jgi:hypothetical protein
MAGRPAGQLPFFQQKDIRPTGFCQVVQNAAAGDTTADNDRSRLTFNLSKSPKK